MRFGAQDTLSLSAATREDGSMVDRWILSANSDLFGSTAGDTAAELDAFATAVPEPGTVSLAALGLIGLIRRHRCA